MSSKNREDPSHYSLAACRVMKVGSLSLLCVCHQLSSVHSLTIPKFVSATSVLRSLGIHTGDGFIHHPRVPLSLHAVENADHPFQNVDDRAEVNPTRRKQTSTKLRQRGQGATSPTSSSYTESESTRGSVRSYNNNPKSSSRSRRAISSSSSLWYQREELVRHDLLTREEELALANAIVQAKELREKMTLLLQENEKKAYDPTDNDTQIYDYGLLENDFDFTSISIGEEDYIIDELDSYDDMRRLDSIYGILPQESYRDKAYSRSNTAPKIASVLDAKKLNVAAMDADVNNLTDTEIVEQLQISGGRRELLNILHSGSEARTEMMRSNIRLVVSIAKKWMRKGIGHTSNDNLMALYDGGWDRPSFDDVIQEGVLGLARAVDKYEPSRGLRFSTYSSYWISNYIRQLFLTCSTGSLKIPTPLHEYKNAYKTIIKRSIELMVPFPTEEAIASEIGTTVSRLRTALRVTDSLLSIDQPIYMGGGAAFKGSGAGGDLSGDVGLLISDTLQCSETRAEELVDVCFLRQCLENAMATELSPHERDVIRLRLGLDDGQSRTVKEVAEECGGGVSVSEIRSVEKRAFKKLRNPSALHAHNLMDFLDMIGVKGETLKNWNWY